MTLAERLSSIVSAIFGRKSPAAEDLRESELRFRQVTENIREVFFLVDPEMSRMYYVSPGYEEIWGRSCDSLYANPRSFADGIHADDAERAMQAFAPHGTVIPFDVEYRIVRPNGTIRWIRARGFPIRNESGDVYRFAGIAEDITERKDAMDTIRHQTQALERNNKRLSLLGEMTGLLQTVDTVEEAAEVLGGQLNHVHVGEGGALYLYKESRNYLDLLARWGELEFPDSVLPDECWALRRGQPYRAPAAERGLRCKHGPHAGRESESLCLPMMVKGGPIGLLHVVFNDESSATRGEEVQFTERMSDQLGLALSNFRLRETLRLEAMEDSLTGLFNRRFLEISLKREFARAQRDDTSIAVAMLDVDHFKRFNDAHSHEAGDAVLRQLGQTLVEHCRLVDLACRFGGEEFAVVFPGATREGMAAWAERFLRVIREMKVVAEGQALPKITVSIGIAFFPDHGEETADVVRAADRALYAAKNAGRDRYSFSPENPKTADDLKRNPPDSD